MAEHVARMGDRKNAYRVFVGHLKVRDHLKDLRVRGKIILKWIFKKQSVKE